MKKFLVLAAFATIMVSCGNEGSSTIETEDTTSPASGATGMGAGTGNDTTSMDVGAVQPTDGNTPLRDTTDVPGADRSGVKYKINNGDTGGGSE